MSKYTAIYFKKTTEIIKKHRPDSEVTIQFFQRQDDVMLSGIKESLEFLEKHTDTSKFEIKHLNDGDIINAMDIVLQFKGKYEHFGIYEGIIDGILARASSIATNAYRIKKLTNKEIIFMGDRADHYLNQSLDGYSVALGGIKTQVTDAQIELHDGIAVGTVPHALIQMFEGDLIAALKAYKETFPQEKLVALVDFNNDVITDSLKVWNEFKDELKAIRIDTSDGVSDAYFKNDEEFGVTPNLIKATRKALDEAGAKDVKIIVSSGFNEKKIKMFEELNVPVDVYGVGGSLLKITNNFTADAVVINDKKIAKVGRNFRENPKLQDYKMKSK